METINSLHIRVDKGFAKPVDLACDKSIHCQEGKKFLTQLPNTALIHATEEDDNGTSVTQSGGFVSVMNGRAVLSMPCPQCQNNTLSSTSIFGKPCMAQIFFCRPKQKTRTMFCL